MPKLKKIFLGTFKTNGNLLATDPCYAANSGDAITLKVKPGEYKAYVSLGRLKAPVCSWDKSPLASRNSRIIIQHSNSPKSLKYEKMDKHVGVDSGQAGFFNVTNYRKKNPTPVPLTGKQFSFWREQAILAGIEAKRENKILKELDKNEDFVHMKKYIKNHKETVDFFKKVLESKLRSEKKYKGYIKAKTFPDYVKLEESNEFYQIMCSLTSDEHFAGVFEPYGAVASAGLGDGGYSLYVARDAKKEIVGCYIEFLSPSEFRSN